MTHEPLSAFVRCVGVVTPAGFGLEALHQRIDLGPPCFSEALRFELPPERSTLVGDLSDALLPEGALPRCHRLALAAVRQLAGQLDSPPDAVVLGITTGGLSATESALRRNETDPGAFVFHGLDTVTEVVADAVGCTGLRLTLSTACSSGAVALAVGRELLRAGLARRVLAGGVDALCQLTVQGFSLLRVCDPRGCRPLDIDRRGMTVAEGAALLVLDVEPSANLGDVALVGAGLTCDAHHPTAPIASGEVAAQAMRLALADAGLSPGAVGYLNLHGTGTRDNDAAEARAVHLVFGDSPPPLSSTKGAVGHALAASGAIEAALAVSILRSGRIPPNTGLTLLDPALGLAPVREPMHGDVRVVQSNSLGFGGNNASLVLSSDATVPKVVRRSRELWVLGAGVVTGAGTLDATWDVLRRGRVPSFILPDRALAEILTGTSLRRLGRLAQLALAATLDAASPSSEVGSVFYGTGWGALRETYEFLQRLWATGGVFSSPLAFSASVHNAVAGQLAMHWGARGANVTAVGRGDALAQAALLASLLGTPQPGILVVADEWHPELSPRLDGTLMGLEPAAREADGAAALLVSTVSAPGAVARVEVLELSGVPLGPDVDQVVDVEGCDAILTAGLHDGGRQHAASVPVVDLYKVLGPQPSAAGQGLALAVRALQEGLLPAGLVGAAAITLSHRRILVRGQGSTLLVRAP